MSDHPRGDLALYRRLWGQARPYRLHLAGAFALALLGTPLALLTPIPVKIAVDHVVGGAPVPAWLGAVLPAGGGALGVLAADPETGEERFARVKVPEGFDRFVSVGKRLVPLEAVIAHFLPMLFPGMEISERALFRVTRDADFELSDDADDLLEAVDRGIDLFDCVLPTRNARNGQLFTRQGPLNIKNARFAEDDAVAFGSTPAEFAIFIKQEQARWGEVVKKAKLKAD